MNAFLSSLDPFVALGSGFELLAKGSAQRARWVLVYNFLLCPLLAPLLGVSGVVRCCVVPVKMDGWMDGWMDGSLVRLPPPLTRPLVNLLLAKKTF